MEACNDCKYYLPVDVFKGLCKLSKSKLTPEDKACDKFAFAPKCKHCKNYTQTNDNAGLCKGSVNAYPDMLAKTCEEFQFSKN